MTPTEPSALHTPLRRTAAEIAARMAEVSDGFLNFQSDDLLEWLPYELAKPHLKDGVTKKEWSAHQETGDPLIMVSNYLPFAWKKANSCRGLSAGRSIEHLKAWLWLAGYDLSDTLDDQYTRYGKPCLIIASEIVGFNWREHDDGAWLNSEDGPELPARTRDTMIACAQEIARNAKAEPTP